MKTYLAVVLFALSSAGCSMVAPIPVPQKSWNQAAGQVQAAGGKVNVVGEITVRYDDTHFLAEVTKGPGLGLLKIYAEGKHPAEVHIGGAIYRRGWKGNPASAPQGLRAWSALPEAFHWAGAGANKAKGFAFSIAEVRRAGSGANGQVSRLSVGRDGEEIVMHLDQ